MGVFSNFGEDSAILHGRYAGVVVEAGYRLSEAISSGLWLCDSRQMIVNGETSTLPPSRGGYNTRFLRCLCNRACTERQLRVRVRASISITL